MKKGPTKNQPVTKPIVNGSGIPNGSDKDTPNQSQFTQIDYDLVNRYKSNTRDEDSDDEL